jgi:enoyl-CoA hydratase/carnithine racemase
VLLRLVLKFFQVLCVIVVPSGLAARPWKAGYGRENQDVGSRSAPLSLILTEKRGHVAILTLNRPEAMNALGAPGDGDQVAAACEAINDDQDIRCVILTGAGKAFSAGGDVKAMKAREGAFGGNGVAVRDGYRKNIHRIVRAIYGLEVPSIAAVNGAAIGLGCDVACMTDIRIAADTADSASPS